MGGMGESEFCVLLELKSFERKDIDLRVLEYFLDETHRIIECREKINDDISIVSFIEIHFPHKLFFFF